MYRRIYFFKVFINWGGGWFVFKRIEMHSFGLTREQIHSFSVRFCNLGPRTFLTLKKGKKFSKASKSRQYAAQNINATASATRPHNYPQLFSHLNGKFKAEKGVAGVSGRKLLTLASPLCTGSGLNTACSAATPVNQKQVHIHGLGMLFYQKKN